MQPGYKELTRQNWGFLSDEEQALISQTRVLLAGCGLGSNIAVLATRTGFSHFILADGDAVEDSNLNRQAFRKEHVRQNKAEVTAKLINEINPEAQTQVIPEFLKAEDADNLIPQCDLVVNMVDPGPAMDAFLNVPKEKGKISLFPMNLAFGGVLLAFGPESPTLEELLGSNLNGDLFVGIVTRLMPHLPAYLWQFAGVAQRIQREGIAPPQLGIASSITTSLVVEAMVRVALGSPPPLVPTIISLDSREPRLVTWSASH